LPTDRCVHKSKCVAQQDQHTMGVVFDGGFTYTCVSLSHGDITLKTKQGD